MPRIKEGFKGERMVVLPAYLIEQLRHDPLGLELYITDIGYSFIGATANTQMARVEHGLGKTFPGVATPWGMTQVSPNTITGGDNGAGYSYEHTTIEGFALTQMSGPRRAGCRSGMAVWSATHGSRDGSCRMMLSIESDVLVVEFHNLTFLRKGREYT